MKRPQPQQFHYMVTKQNRPDGLVYYDWQVIDNMGWSLASGTVHGSEAKAIDRARKAISAILGTSRRRRSKQRR